jgi:DNA-binding MarR family transcriptional regulator
MNYFKSIVESLNQEDLIVLNELYSNDATSNYKSYPKQLLNDHSKLSTSIFRKTICRLEAMGFIFTSFTKKNHMLFLSDFGLMAINEIINENEGVEA